MDEAMDLILNIKLHSSDDREALSESAIELLDELAEVNVDSAELLKGDEAPEGAKSTGVVTLGALAVAVLPTFLPKLIQFLQAWVLRDANRSVVIKRKSGNETVEIKYSSSRLSDDSLIRILDKLQPKNGKKQLSEESSPWQKG